MEDKSNSPKITLRVDIYMPILNRRMSVDILESQWKDVLAQKELISGQEPFIYKNEDISIWLTGNLGWEDEDEELKYYRRNDKMLMPNGDIL